MQPRKTIEEVREIIGKVAFKTHGFFVTEQDDHMILQVKYLDPDVHTGKVEMQHTRKWPISHYATTSEVVQTAFKAIVTSQEHIAREFFTYKGEQVFGPHFNVEDLVELAKSRKPDVREKAE